MEPTYHLDQTFTHRTPTHEFQIKWTRIGDPSLPTLIFIHGTPWSNVVWQPLATALSTRYNIYLYDHPGFGTSPSPRRLKSTDTNTESSTSTDDLTDLDGPLTLRTIASAALINHWNLPTTHPPHIIAHDNGGLVSLRLLLTHSISMSSLTLIDVVAIPPFGLPFFKLVAENLEVFQAIPPNMLEGLVRAYVRSAAYNPLPPGVEDMLSAPWLTGGSQGTAGFLRELRQGHHRAAGDVEEMYERVAGLVPVKVIWGAEDAWIPKETAGKVSERFGAREFVVVERAGHLIMYDAPERVAVEVGVWLEGIVGQRKKD